MTERETISRSKSHLLPQLRPDVWVRRYENLLFISGIVGCHPNGELEPDFERQVELAYDNLKAKLAAENCTFDDIVDVTALLSGAKHHVRIAMKIQHKIFGLRPLPNWTPIGTTWLDGADFEIKAIARIPE